MKLFTAIGILSLAIMINIACKKETPAVKAPAYKNLAQVIAGTPNLSLFYQALQKTGLDKKLSADTGVFTVFAPVDSAFQAAGWTAQTIDQMNDSTLKDLVAYHIAVGNFPSPRIGVSNTYVLTMSDSLPTQVTNSPGDYDIVSQTYIPLTGGIIINTARVIIGDIEASNGVLQIINRVNNPPSTGLWDLIGKDPGLSYFRAALNALGLDNYFTDPSFKPLTVFIPDNDAFIKAGYTDTLQFYTIANQHDATTDTLTHIVSAGIVPYYSYFVYQAIASSLYGVLYTVNNGSLKVLTLNGKSIVATPSSSNTSNLSSYSRAGFISSDYYASDGVLNKIDHVLNDYAP